MWTQMRSEENHYYERFDIIGTGAYGTVYKACNKKTNQIVALKKICVPLEEDGIPLNTLREVALLKQLATDEHPNIVKLLDICHGQQIEQQLIMFLVFEHIDQDLATYIEQHSRNGFSTIQIRNLARDILSGVDFIHSNRIVHRDLKPQNILVTREGRAKLADFGLAKSYDFEMKLTSVVVTLWYRAPEVLLRSSYATPVDIWSVGCIMAELYSLKPLFRGISEHGQLCKIFSIIGTPHQSEWPENTAIQHNAFAPRPKVNLPTEIPNLCETACDLVLKMLIFDPRKRISALEALQHTFFTEEPINT